MLHQVNCLHFGTTDWVAGEELGSLTKIRKVCSNNESELHEWVRQQERAPIKRCSDCSPFDTAN